MTEKCSEKLCARMPYKRRSQFSRHFLSPDFGAFHARLEFFNTHGILRQLTGRSVQRYQRELGLPVRRPARGGVYWFGNRHER